MNDSIHNHKIKAKTNKKNSGRDRRNSFTYRIFGDSGSVFVGLIFISLAVGFGIPLLVYTLVFRGGFSHDNADWGNFGLYLAGIAGPFFSFASFVGLILTLNNSIKEKEGDDAQVLFFRYIDAVLKQNMQNTRDTAALKKLYDRLCMTVKNGDVSDNPLPSAKEIQEKQNRNVKFFLLVYAIIDYIRSTPKLDNMTYITILFSYLTYDEKYVFAVDMRNGRPGQNIPPKMQQAIVSTFMDWNDFCRRMEILNRHI
ncbi:MAG: hypothetical protein M0P01_08295 [Treponema sp.]|nr:hypothetical protein [Treponema sp.]